MNEQTKRTNERRTKEQTNKLVTQVEEILSVDEAGETNYKIKFDNVQGGKKVAQYKIRNLKQLAYFT